MLMVVSLLILCICGFIFIENTMKHTPVSYTHLDVYKRQSRECTCTESQIRHYRARLSGPFLDRIDLFIHVNSPVGRILPGEKSEISSEQLKKGVLRARRAQKERFRTEKIRYNSQMSSRHLEKYCRLDRESERLLEEAYEKLRTVSYTHLLRCVILI